jgi:hypothetical protein
MKHNHVKIIQIGLKGTEIATWLFHGFLKFLEVSTRFFQFALGIFTTKELFFLKHFSRHDLPQYVFTGRKEHLTYMSFVWRTCSLKMAYFHCSGCVFTMRDLFFLKHILTKNDLLDALYRIRQWKFTIINYLRFPHDNVRFPAFALGILVWWPICAIHKTSAQCKSNVYNTQSKWNLISIQNKIVSMQNKFDFNSK